MGHVTAIVPPAPAPSPRVSVEHEMQRAYIDYAMSVIVARALPDVRDGMKPVHRRIIYGAHDGGFTSENSYKKSARIVGDVMGKYHPHGDSSIYDAMVRMAQPFSMRAPLIDGQGNFGSPDGDPPAAMRYTEARLARITDQGLVEDIDEGTVDFRPTYDASGREPKVLPARFPNLLVNGGEGIAVGMATKIPPHNLGEVIDATLALIDDPDIDPEALLRIMPGPDFPTGGVIQGRGAVREAFMTGRGSLTMASVHEIEQAKGGKQLIVFTELPYQVNKTVLLEKLAELVNAKTVEGVSDLRDESSDKGVRVVVELKRDANVELVLNQLRKNTDVVKSFPVNATCLDARGNPRVMGAVQMLREFVAFRRETIARRSRFRLEKARSELEKQIGFFAARSMVDEVVRLIRAASDTEAARASLLKLEFPAEGELAVLLAEVDPDAEPQAVFRLTEAQARNILALRLSSLTALEQEAIANRCRELSATMQSLLGILADRSLLDAVMKQEMAEIRAKFATPRMTRIESAGPADISDDDLVEDKPVVLTLTRQGYVKVTPLDAYREQSRGGKGKTGMDTKDDDVVSGTLVCTARTVLTFFTSRGIAHTIKAYKLPETAANARGKPIVNFLQLRKDETIATVMPMPDASAAAGRFMVFVTDQGDVRRNAASDFARVQAGGKVAMKLEDEHGNPTARLIAVLETGEDDDVVLGTRRGKAVRFPATEIRVFKGRESTGNKGITLGTEDEVISACVVRHFEATPQERDAYFSEGTTTWKDDDGTERSLVLTAERMAEMAAAEQTLLTVTAKGYGKRFSTHDFRTTGRGGQGVWAGSFGDATGELVALMPVSAADGLVLVTDGAQTIRTRCSEIRVLGRSTRGVKLFDLPGGQAIVDVARVPAEE